jgi:hypothetical protein
MYRLLLIFVVFELAACGGDSGSYSSDSALEAALESNDSWPDEAVGILDIVEATFYRDTDDVEWAIGSLVNDDDEFGVSIEIEGDVISRAGINIDSGKKVHVWLGRPNTEYGIKTYPVTKAQSL